jgi:hypothetical protein
MTMKGIEPKRVELIHNNGTATTVLVEGIKGAASGVNVSVKDTELVRSTDL